MWWWFWCFGVSVGSVDYGCFVICSGGSSGGGRYGYLVVVVV